MDWVKLIIPLIAVAVWILSHLANQQKEARRAPRSIPPPRPRERLESLPTATMSKHDDQYREEMDRKREPKPTGPRSLPRLRKKEQDSGQKPPPLPANLEPIFPPVIPAKRQDRERERQAREREERARELREQERRQRRDNVPPPLPPAVVAPEAVAKVGEAGVVLVKAPPRAIVGVFGLLKTPENIATAFLLKEILDRPVAKRFRRRVVTKDLSDNT